MNKFYKILILILILNSSLFAKMYAGPYIGIGYGQASLNDSGYYKNVQNDIKSYNFLAGAYINKYLAVELEYFKSGNFNIIDINKNHGLFNYSAFTINTILHYYWYKNLIDTHIKFGAGQSNTSMSLNSGSALLYSGGIGYMINKRYSIGVNYNLYTFSYKDIRRGSFSMSLEYINMYLKIKF